MYQPVPFRVAAPSRLHALMQAHPFAMVVAGGEIAHLPVLLAPEGDRGTLRLHVAMANPMAKMDGTPATVVFRGPDAYVSPSWYEEPDVQVPTWNYAVVHARGVLSRMSAAELRTLLEDLARRFEGQGGWSPSATRPGFIEELLPAIVGFRVPIDALEGKYKLSQNRSPADAQRVRRAFEERGQVELAAMMADWIER